MTTHSSPPLRSIRVFLITITAGFARGVRSLSGPSAPRRGLILAVLLLAAGAGQAVACEEEHVSIEDLLKDSGYVVGNYGPAAETARGPLTQDEVLAGSGYESATTQFAGSGDDDDTGQLDETERALALHELSTAPSSPYINGRGQLAYELTEHASAPNAQASQAGLAPYADSPNTTF